MGLTKDAMIEEMNMAASPASVSDEAKELHREYLVKETRKFMETMKDQNGMVREHGVDGFLGAFFDIAEYHLSFIDGDPLCTRCGEVLLVDDSSVEKISYEPYLECDYCRHMTGKDD